MKNLISFVIGSVPAYFLGKTFVGYIPPFTMPVKPIIFLFWFISLTIIFGKQVQKLAIIKETWRYSKIPVILIVAFLSFNVANFIAYIIPNENIYALFRAVAQTTGVVIPMNGSLVVFGIISSCTFLVALGALYELNNSIVTKVSEKIQERKTSSTVNSQ